MQSRLSAISAALLFQFTFASAGVDPDWATTQSRTLVTECRKDFKKYISAFNDAEKIFLSKIEKVSLEEIMKIEGTETKAQPNPFLAMARELWPHLLPKSYPGRMVYTECGIPLRRLHHDGGREALEEWKICLAAGYHGDLPKLTIELLSCYEAMLKPGRDEKK